MPRFFKRAFDLFDNHKRIKTLLFWFTIYINYLVVMDIDMKLKLKFTYQIIN